MSKMINYDFTVDSLVSVKAPKGTDPDTLIEKALQKLIQRAKEGDVALMFDTVFDSETGSYYDDWENKSG
tara:strand:+ start:305 stop:514 length:210 start_codon:yes stop_codon:yes gene_type:complete